MSLQIELKKSAVSQKQPFPSDLALGEIALNYNADGPFLTCKDTAGNIRKLTGVWVGTSAPSSPTAGDPWLDTTSTPVLKIYNGSTWVSAISVSPATTSAYGTVRLATTADVTNGTAGKVVDAAQLASRVTADIASALAAVQISSANILNGTIVDSDINAAAEIAVSKLADGAARQLLQTNAAGTGVEWTSNVDVPGTLDVTGATTLDSTLTVPLGSSAAPTVRFAGDTNTGIYSPGADQLAVATNGSERLRITSEGAVGIGTASPATKLHVNTDGGTSLPTIFSGTGLVVSRTGGDAANAQVSIISGNAANAMLAFGDTDSQYAGSLTYLHDVDAMRFATTATERARIDSSARLLVGTSSARANFGNSSFSARLQIEGTGFSDTAISSVRSNDDAAAATFIFGKNRGGVGTNVIVQDNDELGQIFFSGNDGSEFVNGAAIRAFVDGTPGADDMPGRLVFSVTAAGASTPTEALRISSDRSITVSDGGHIVLGTTTGTKIGTAATQKLGFYNATPVVQPAAVADITTTATSGSLPVPDGSVTIADAATPTVTELLEYCVELEAKLEAALGHLRTLGLIAA